MQPLSQIPAEVADDGSRERVSVPLATRGRTVAVTRVLGVIAAALLLGLFIASLRPIASEFQVHAALADSSGGRAARDLAARLATYQVVLVGLAATGYFAVAGIIFWRRSHDTAALFVTLTLVAFGVALPGTMDALVTGHPIWDVPFGLLQAVGWLFLLLFAFLFPDARFVPRWTSLLAVAAACWVIAFFVLAPTIVAPRPWLIALTFAIWVAWFALGVLVQGYRYVRVATRQQRQQTKWIVLGFLGAIGGVLVAAIPHILRLTSSQRVIIAPGYVVAATTIATLCTLLIPLSISIAILRHRLFDIDLIINRTLVYGTLSLSLVVIYMVMVFGLQWLTGLLLHQSSSTLAIVATTLLIAALFNPLRLRLQRTIDRRFYRARYSAVRTLAAFSATLRNEVDLAQLREQLLAVVDKTMQPAHVSLWLRSPTAADVRRAADPTDVAH